MNKEQRNAAVDAVIEETVAFMNKDLPENEQYDAEDVKKIKGGSQVLLGLWDIIMPAIVSDIVNAVDAAHRPNQ